MMKSRFTPARYLTAVAGLALLAACGDGESGDGQMAESEAEKVLKAVEQMRADFLEQQKTFLDNNAEREGVVVTESGLQYRIIEEGDGASPTKDDQVTVHYTGRFVDGTVFDSSYEREKPATFPAGGLIAGWVEALPMMQVGDKWELVIPASLGYGDRGAGEVIPGGATLIFEMELLDVIKADN